MRDAPSGPPTIPPVCLEFSCWLRINVRENPVYFDLNSNLQVFFVEPEFTELLPCLKIIEDFEG